MYWFHNNLLNDLSPFSLHSCSFFNKCSSTIVCFSGSSKVWLAFQAMYTHWSQLWNMPVKTKSWSKHLSWWVTYWLLRNLFLNSVPKRGTLNVSRLQERSETLLPERFIELWTIIPMFQSSTYSIVLWKSFSALLWGWTKTACPLLLLLANLCLAILLGEERVLKMQVHSLIGEHSWTEILARRNPVSNKFQKQSNKSGCCFWTSVCTWILLSLITGTSRNMVKAFNMLNSWHSLRTACIPDLFFFKMRQRYFSSTCLSDTDFKELIRKHLLWRNLIDRVMEMILLGSSGAHFQRRDF